jgi:hypothetical protein
MIDALEVQQCKTCMNDYPLSEEYFDTYIKRISLFHPECVSCREARLIVDREKRQKYKEENFLQFTYAEYVNSAKKRELEFSLTQDELNNLIFLPCFYCGDSPGTGPTDRVGLDRVDPDKGYIKENVIPCCWTCNRAKSVLTQEEFFELCKKIVIKHKLLENS